MYLETFTLISSTLDNVRFLEAKLLTGSQVAFGVVTKIQIF